MTTPTLTTIAQLEQIYGQPTERAIIKAIPYLNADYRAFVEASPFVVLSSVGPDGTDCSPKGDAPGFVRLLDERTLAIPDRPGNNRIDNLRNIVEDGRVSLLFIVPGVGETLRVNGTAAISADPALLASFAVQDKLPRTVILVTVRSAYFHCSKALVRSKLWDPAQHVERARLPSPGAMHHRLSGGTFDGEAYDRELPARTQASLY
ncbi:MULTISPECIES: pyridoxamine 5'-phosphate oxidase family protein [Ralstonia solanacearum species complex]|uniref:Pyridoxamine 5'-phosphate oxidase-like, fmn-binding protein n=3 Tax=Ralstonia solanacearum TaxID=305 RepID=A0ABF7R926_RALSL|nr:pyridoxamine 5'-phosphate oxidase family protein [Ralstonia solanacearum]ALF89467.1 Pyridoxamine 5'-phosphate oxidase [Ralstonia solanacearum]ATI28847.1 pyridoxamine 5'-phosphate oxidase [Ralstonia solanacearum]EAP74524.1 Phosphohydrolase (MutT/nudix family protein) [Ralstonia solanacearum UW551]KEI34258.1 pyridoxamine 5'-phosphate oxidase [Ralstonia solanacearum]KFX28955.1 pyridoxamine 5'-phosphate oxidase [Ralstonia solanacearum]